MCLVRYQFLQYLGSFSMESFKISYLTRPSPAIKINRIRPITPSSGRSIF